MRKYALRALSAVVICLWIAGAAIALIQSGLVLEPALIVGFGGGRGKPCRADCPA